MSSEIFFSSKSNCPSFNPNPFKKKDVCSICQFKLRDHSSATPEQAKEALEFSDDKIPSEIWRDDHSPASVFMGGYKSAFNLDFLKEKNVLLIIDTAPSLVKLFGPKYQKNLDKRRTELPEINEIRLDWVDSPDQVLSYEEIRQSINSINAVSAKGGSILVHCAQEKSRSGVISAAFLSNKLGIPISEALTRLKQKRALAEPNPGFSRQLRKFGETAFWET